VLRACAVSSTTMRESLPDRSRPWAQTETWTGYGYSVGVLCLWLIISVILSEKGLFFFNEYKKNGLITTKRKKEKKLDQWEKDLPRRYD
jgi:hypothetical protein